MAENVLDLTTANFDAEVSGGTPVFVDFWAEWCGPCRAVAPTVKELATDYAGRLKVGKLNVDDAQDIAEKFMVTSIPTFIIFKNGQAVDRAVGAMSKPQFQSFINRNL